MSTNRIHMAFHDVTVTVWFLNCRIGLFTFYSDQISVNIMKAPLGYMLESARIYLMSKTLT